MVGASKMAEAVSAAGRESTAKAFAGVGAAAKASFVVPKVVVVSCGAPPLTFGRIPLFRVLFATLV